MIAALPGQGADAMLARMADFGEIDRQLDALGKVPEDVASLLARNLGDNRTRAALDKMLDALGSPIGPEPVPEPVPVPLPVPLPDANTQIEAADDDDFEMLIEDEEILEIQEDDVEEDVPSDKS